ncbi:hypothetical protein [Xanthomonas arboricola]|uniref:hypothetical protein n=1 Tax=Xanthomonas arboricola TaxID=56448 RepID=UPI001AF2F633|nr:hypothetical protein [Xanthomonas arboricola]CAD7380988.1 hypothetical protein X12_002087 [Xanthomonas arboricola]CAG2089972.1 hypothetical protein XCY_002086 [Xanthomonas arboricola pv. juglandis]
MFGVAIALATAAKRRVVGDALTSIQSVAELGFKQGVCCGASANRLRPVAGEGVLLAAITLLQPATR